MAGAEVVDEAGLVAEDVPELPELQAAATRATLHMARSGRNR